MGIIIGVGDQLLADIIARAVPKEAKVEILALRDEVPDCIIHEPTRGGHEQQQNDDLDRD